MYRSAAVATTFSPRFLAVLAEAGRVSSVFGVPLRLIHAGEQTEEKQNLFSEGLANVELPADTVIHWVEGDPGTAVLGAVREHGIDLLIAGAVDAESGYRPFANDLAKTFLGQAPSDLLLFLRPQIGPSPVRRPVVIVDFSAASAGLLRDVMELAAKRKCEKVYVISILTTFDEHRLRAAGGALDLEERLDKFVMNETELQVPVETVWIRGNTGFGACEFVQGIDADLLAVPTGMPGGSDPILSRSMDWLFQVIPCNLWVRRAR
ncbi:MAG TPA: universal stress protein [Chthoniobacterales bacterium]